MFRWLYRLFIKITHRVIEESEPPESMEDEYDLADMSARAVMRSFPLEALIGLIIIISFIFVVVALVSGALSSGKISAKRETEYHAAAMENVKPLTLNQELEFKAKKNPLQLNGSKLVPTWTAYSFEITDEHIVQVELRCKKFCSYRLLKDNQTITEDYWIYKIEDQESKERVARDTLYLDSGSYIIEVGTWDDFDIFKKTMYLTVSTSNLPSTTEQEDNNTIKTSNKISLNQVIRGSITASKNQEPDTDVFQFELKDPSNISFYFNNYFRDSSFCVYRQDDMNIPIFQVESRENQTEVSESFELDAGVYLISIKPDTDEMNSNYIFQLIES